VTYQTATFGQYAGNTGGFHTSVLATLTRPDNTTAYATGDGITNSTTTPSAIEFPNCTRWFGTSALLLGGILAKSTTTTSQAAFILHLWNDIPPEIPNDNAAYEPTARANFGSYIGALTVDKSSGGTITFHDGIAKGFTMTTGTAIPFTVSNTSRSLYGILQANGNYTPGALEQFQIKLFIQQN